MNVVMIIPTGIGCEIGGHAGDATPAAKLLAACCDTLILHPNVVNASDINEMPHNSLYVEGSMLNRFLYGEIHLKRVLRNRVLLVANKPIAVATINAVSAARAVMGADIEILPLDKPLRMIVKMDGPKAAGEVFGWRKLVEQVNEYEFDALAIHSKIESSFQTEINYFTNGGVNPWGGIEAITSKLISDALDKPVAHAPLGLYSKTETTKLLDIIVDPRMAAEIQSEACLCCVLKGLHSAPRIDTKGLHRDEIDCLVTPVGCVGEPHWACLEAGIPIMAVRENTTVLNDSMPDEFIFVDNYIEAAGLLMSMQAGILPASVKRPLKKTIILKGKL